MNSSERLPLLFQCAAEYRFDEFDALFAQLVPALSPQELPDAYGIRAQIKLLAADATLLADLERAAGPGIAARFPCLDRAWLPDSPNRFVVFPSAPGAMADFLRALPQAGAYLGLLYGEDGRSMARQVQSEILYFMADFDGALRLAREQLSHSPASHASAILAQHVIFRCHLAAGEAQETQQCMLDMIRLAKASPECHVPYLVIRNWANLTTGWSGDTPRFLPVSSGEPMPVLEDRLEAIRKGISRLSPSEAPFAAYAARSYADAYTMRQYYMDVFHAIYWLQAGDLKQMSDCFAQAHHISMGSGLLMPFVEYGGQLLQLLRHIRDGQGAYSRDWLEKVLALAGQYEASLNAYRA